MDIDNEKECDTARRCFEVWTAAQQKRVQEIYGDLGLSEAAGPPSAGADSDRSSKSEGS